MNLGIAQAALNKSKVVQCVTLCLVQTLHSFQRRPVTQLACVCWYLCFVPAVWSLLTVLQLTAYRNLNKVTRLPFSIGRSTLMPTSTWGTWYERLSYILFSVRADSVLISMITQYLDIGRHDDAIAAFKSAITLQRDHANSWNNLGLFYENMSKWSCTAAEECIFTIDDNTLDLYAYQCSSLNQYLKWFVNLMLLKWHYNGLWAWIMAYALHLANCCSILEIVRSRIDVTFHLCISFIFIIDLHYAWPSCSHLYSVIAQKVALIESFPICILLEPMHDMLYRNVQGSRGYNAGSHQCHAR